MRTLFGITAATLLFCLVPAEAQEAGSASAGLAYVRANCITCHAVEAGDQTSPYFDAPTFDSVAATPGMTGLALSVFLQTPHATMPNFVISPEDQANIVAYILSLRPAPKT